MSTQASLHTTNPISPPIINPISNEDLSKGIGDINFSLEEIKSKLASLETNVSGDNSFKSTLENVKEHNGNLSWQIALCGFLVFLVIMVELAIQILFMFSNTNGEISKISLVTITSFSIAVLSILASYIFKINKIRESLTNKYLALSTFSEVQNILRNADNTLNYEYRTVIKRILDSLNNLIDNPKST